LLQGDLEVVLLLNQVLLLLFQICALFPDDVCQKLIFKAFFCDREVNKCGLGLCFWSVVRVRELCLEIYLEIVIILNLVFSQLDGSLASWLLNDRAR